MPRVMKRSSFAPLGVEDAERCVARPRDLARGLQHLVEHGFRIELRQQAPADIDQAAQTLIVQMVIHGVLPPSSASKAHDP